MTEPPKRKESHKSYKGGKVVYYEQKESDTMIEMNVKDMEDQNLYKPGKDNETQQIRNWKRNTVKEKSKKYL